MDDAGVDFAFVAWQEDRLWQLAGVPRENHGTVADVAEFARARQGESGSVAFVSVAEEFFVGLRVQGAHTRVLLSDVNAAFDWALAEEAADLLGIDLDELELDEDDIEPAGDLTVLADFGVSPADVDALCSDPELYPDEQIAALAERVGFGEELGALLDSAGA